MITPLDASIGAKKKKKTMIVVPREDKMQMERMALQNEEAAAGLKEVREDDE